MARQRSLGVWLALVCFSLAVVARPLPAAAQGGPQSGLLEYLSLASRLQTEVEAIEQQLGRDVLRSEGASCPSPEAVQKLQEQVAAARRAIEKKSARLEAAFEQLMASVPPGTGGGRNAGQGYQAYATLALTRDRLRGSAERLKQLEAQLSSVAAAGGRFATLETSLDECRKAMEAPKACVLPQADATVANCKAALQSAAVLDSLAAGGGDRPLGVPGCNYSIDIPQVKRLIDLREQLKRKLKECLKETACPAIPFTETGYFTGRVVLEIPRKTNQPWDWFGWPHEQLPGGFTKTCAPPQYPMCGPAANAGSGGPVRPAVPPRDKSLRELTPRAGFETTGVCSEMPTDLQTGLPACLRRLPYNEPKDKDDPNRFACNNSVLWWKVFTQIINQANAQRPGFVPYETASLTIPGHTLGMSCQRQPDATTKRCCLYESTIQQTLPLLTDACAGQKDATGKTVPVCWTQASTTPPTPPQQTLDALQHYLCCTGDCYGPTTDIHRNRFTIDDNLGDRNYPMLLDPDGNDFKEFQAFIEKMTGIKIKVVSTKYIPGYGYSRVELEISMPRGMCVEGCTLPKVPKPLPPVKQPTPPLRAKVPPAGTRVSGLEPGPSAVVTLSTALARVQAAPLICATAPGARGEIDSGVVDQAEAAVDSLLTALVPFVDALGEAGDSPGAASLIEGDDEDLEAVERRQAAFMAQLDASPAEQALSFLRAYFGLDWSPGVASSIADDRRRKSLVKDTCARFREEAGQYATQLEGLRAAASAELEGSDAQAVITIRPDGAAPAAGTVSGDERGTSPHAADPRLAGQESRGVGAGSSVWPTTPPPLKAEPVTAARPSGRAG